jgi:two-component system cell cycle response regulator
LTNQTRPLLPRKRGWASIGHFRTKRSSFEGLRAIIFESGRADNKHMIKDDFGVHGLEGRKAMAEASALSASSSRRPTAKQRAAEGEQQTPAIAMNSLRALLVLTGIAVIAGNFTGGGQVIRGTALVIAAGVTVARAILVKEERLLWAIFAVAVTAWTGQLYYIVSPNAAVTFPAPPDYMALVFYGGALAGIVVFVKSRLRGRRSSLWMDGVIGGLALSALISLIVFRAALAGSGVETRIVDGQLGYAISDLFVLGFLGALALLGRWRLGWGGWGFIGAFALLALGDSLYVSTVASGQLIPVDFVTSLWAFGSLTLAGAATSGRRVAIAGNASGLVPITLLGVSAMSSLCLLLAYELGLAKAAPALVALAAAVLAITIVRFCVSLLENARILAQSRREATTDALTGLGNRRRLITDLAAHLGDLDPEQPLMLTLFDLDGFKAYNDTFGHPAGDVLLERLGARLRELLVGRGSAYRVGGDEFCALWHSPEVGQASVMTMEAVAALSEHGEAFSIGCSYGSVLLPNEAGNQTEAFRLADRRMYTRKRNERASAGRQSSDVLLRALSERDSALGVHLGGTAELACATATRLGVPEEDLEAARQTALLHDVGKVAIPDEILSKPGPLDEHEWAFMKRHTLIGERILSAAPALARVSRFVRSTHERYDGGGYPDGLAGDDIPLIARIVTVCDSYHAMVTKRAYRDARDSSTAIAELRHCSGKQFDPDVVEAFASSLDGGGDHGQLEADSHRMRARAAGASTDAATRASAAR